MSAVIVQVTPIWAREDVVMALTGLPQNAFRRICNEGKVRACKLDPSKPSSAVTFRVQDVLDWLEENSGHKTNYVIAGAENG